MPNHYDNTVIYVQISKSSIYLPLFYQSRAIKSIISKKYLNFGNNFTTLTEYLISKFLSSGALLAGYVEVGDQVFISGNCVLHQFVTIGRLAMLGGGCGISKDIPPFCLVKPLLPNTIMGLNSVGLRRSTLTAKERQEIKEAFKLLYLSGLNISQAVEEIKSSFPSGPASEFSAFIEKSERGICVM